MFSAILLNTAFLFPCYLGWLVFFAFSPLFTVILSRHSLTFFHGIIWGVLFWSVHYIPVAYVIMYHGAGSWRGIAYIFLVIYMALISGIWFGIYQGTGRWIARQWHGALFASITIGYLFYITYDCFWIFGSQTGYACGILVLPLVHYPIICRLIQSFGLQVITAGVVGSGFLIAYVQQRRNRWITPVLIGGLLVFLTIPQAQKLAIPEWYYQIAHVTPDQSCKAHPRDCAQDIAYRIASVCGRHPTARVIVMPESSFPFLIDKELWALKLWEMNEERICIFGSFHSIKNDPNIRASILIAQGSRIMKYYDKTIPFPFTEYIPSSWKFLQGISHLFLRGKPKIRVSAPTHGTDPFLLPGLPPLWPALCSDLFFDTQAAFNPIHQKGVILFLANDSWFPSWPMPELMCRYARLVALVKKTDLIYVSTIQGKLILNNGTIVDLLG